MVEGYMEWGRKRYRVEEEKEIVMLGDWSCGGLVFDHIGDGLGVVGWSERQN